MSSDSRFQQPNTIAGLTETRLIHTLTAHARNQPRPGVENIVPNGDDAAVLACAKNLVVTTDTIVEGEDFLQYWSDPEAIAWKLVVQNVADVCAMGGIAHSLTLSAAFPESAPLTWVERFAGGLGLACEHYQVNLIGGDLSASRHMVFTVTALGLVDQPIRRSTAKIGDDVVISGIPGNSAAGLWFLSQDYPRDMIPEVFYQTHTQPSPDLLTATQQIAPLATALIDVSDGLVKDAGRIARGSNASIDFDPAFIDHAAAQLQAQSAKVTADKARHFVLTGGEEHHLLATVPRGTALPDRWHRIGVVEVEHTPNITIGRETYVGPGGWDHFGALGQ